MGDRPSRPSRGKVPRPRRFSIVDRNHTWIEHYQHFCTNLAALTGTVPREVRTLGLVAEALGNRTMIDIRRLSLELVYLNLCRTRRTSYMRSLLMYAVSVNYLSE